MQGILEQREIDLRDKLSYGAAGIEKGRAEEKAEIVKAMYQDGLPIERIAKITKMNEEEIEKIIKED